MDLAFQVDEGSIGADAAEVLVTLFFLHCLINPILCCLRDRSNLGANVKQLLCCKRPTVNVQPTQLFQPPNALNMTHGNLHQTQSQPNIPVTQATVSQESNAETRQVNNHHDANSNIQNGHSNESQVQPPPPSYEELVHQTAHVDPSHNTGGMSDSRISTPARLPPLHRQDGINSFHEPNSIQIESVG